MIRDVEAVRQEATLLKEQMTTVKEDIKKVTRTALHHDDVIALCNDDVIGHCNDNDVVIFSCNDDVIALCNDDVTWVQVERETAQSMQRLVELDSMKKRMLESQTALQVDYLDYVIVYNSKSLVTL